MAINYETLFDLQALAGLENRIPPNVGMNLTGTPNINYLQNLANLAQQQGQQQEPVLGPDDFGSYTIPVSDPTYTSGFNYARSIAGGIPMSQVIAPGVSYSPEMPMGYTQEQLNTPVGTTPTQEPDDPSFLGTGIGGVSLSNLIDLGKINKNLQYMSQKAKEAGITGTGGVDLTGESLRRVYDEGRGLFQNMGNTFKIDQDAIDRIVQERIAERMPTIEQPDFSQFVRREDIPTLIPDVPTGRDFSIDREDLIRDIREGIDLPVYEAPDLSQFVRREDIPSLIPSVPTGKDFSIDRDALIRDIREGIDIPMPQQPDVSQFVTQEDINRAIAGIDIPTYQAPDLSGITTRLSDLEKGLLTLQEPTGGRFSVQQQRPMGLFA